MLVCLEWLSSSCIHKQPAWGSVSAVRSCQTGSAQAGFKDALAVMGGAGWRRCGLQGPSSTLLEAQCPLTAQSKPVLCAVWGSLPTCNVCEWTLRVSSPPQGTPAAGEAGGGLLGFPSGFVSSSIPGCLKRTNERLQRSINSAAQL